MVSESRRAAIALTLVAGFLWGTSFIVINLGLRYVDPFRFVFLRFLVAALVILSIDFFGGNSEASLFKSSTLVLLGLMNACGFTLQFVGQVYTGAANTALLVNLSALIVPVISWRFLNEKFPLGKVVAIMVGVFGVVLLVTRGDFLTVEPHYLGDGLNGLSALVWSSFAVLNKKTIARYSRYVISVTAATLVFTLVALIPLGLFFVGILGLSLGWEAWAAILYTAVVCTVAPYILWNFGLKTLSPTISTLTLLIEVITASALSSMIIGETFDLISGIGASMIMLAIVLASR